MSGRDGRETIESQLITTTTVEEARDLFSAHIRKLGYDYFDALSMNAAMLANPQMASRYFICDYYEGDPWKYLPKGWPADDSLTAQASRSSAPIDYLDYLKSCDSTVSILLQRGMLKTWNVKKAWLFPHNTLGSLRSVTCYMIGNKDDQETIFKETRDALFSLSALLIDHIDSLRLADTCDDEGVMIVDKMPVSFTQIEMIVLVSLSKGQSNQAIADHMSISVNTVRYHLKKIYKKINVSTRAEAISAAINHGYITG